MGLGATSHGRNGLWFATDFLGAGYGSIGRDARLVAFCLRDSLPAGISGRRRRFLVVSVFAGVRRCDGKQLGNGGVFSSVSPGDGLDKRQELLQRPISG